MVNQEQLEMMWSCKLLGQDWFDYWKGRKNSAEHVVFLQASNMWATYEREKLQEPYWRHRKKEWFGLKPAKKKRKTSTMSLTVAEIEKMKLLHLCWFWETCPHDLVWLLYRRLQHDSRNQNPHFWPDRDYLTKVAIELLHHPRKHPLHASRDMTKESVASCDGKYWLVAGCKQ